MPDSLPETASASPETGTETASASDVNSSATPSTAEQGSEKKSMVDAIRGAIAGPEKSPGSETQDPKAGKPEVVEPLKVRGET